VAIGVKQLVSAIRRELEKPQYVNKNPVSKIRQSKLEYVAAQLTAKGFPRSREEKLALSLVPLVFQEANYDEIDWTLKDADLSHLEHIFNIDVQLQNEGKTRNELRDEEFDEYVRLSFAAIDSARSER